MTPDEYTARLKRNMEANPGFSEQEIREALAADGFKDPTLPVDLNAQLKDTVTGATGKVNEVLGAARRGTRNMMPQQLPDVVKELVNPVPGNIGDAAALAAGGAGAAIASKVPGRLAPAAIRALSPAAGGAVGDALSGDPEIVANALLRGAVGIGAEGVGQTIDAYRRVRGLPSRVDTARTSERMGEAGSEITRRDVPVTPGGLVRAGEASPRIGSKAASSSLEAALEGQQRKLYADAAKSVGSKINVDLPDGQRVTFAKALEEYKAAAAGKVDAGGNRIDAEKIWGSIQHALRDSGDPELALWGAAMNKGRDAHAQSMSFVRMVQGLKSEGVVDAKGVINHEKLQAKFHKLVEDGLIDPAVRDQLEAAVKRGYIGPMTDEPGRVNLGTWFRMSPGHGLPGMGFHPKLPELPRQVGTGASGLAPETEPMGNIPRALLSVIGTLTGQNFKESGRDRE